MSCSHAVALPTGSVVIAGVGARIAPKDVHALIPRSCQYIVLHNKRDFADVTVLRTLRWGDDTGLFR